MKSLSFTENQFTGSTIVVPFTALSHLGPKHHAIVIGTNDEDGKLWIAELSRRHGYRLVSLAQWSQDNTEFVNQIRVKPNDGTRSNWDVASSAIQDVISANTYGRKYNVLFNNCETFANRHRTGRNAISPQVKTAMQLAGFAIAGGTYLLKRRFTGGFGF